MNQSLFFVFVGFVIIGFRFFYFQVWHQESSNHKTSNLLDHASSQQHAAAMVLFKKDQARAAGSSAAVASASPIIRCLMNIDEKIMERVKKKFDVCYVMAKECLSFTKYPELEMSHRVDLGPAYVSAKAFTHYIAESQRQKLFSLMSSDRHFFSFLLDGTTGAGNIEDEMVVIQFCIQDSTAKEIRSCARYFTIFNPDKSGYRWSCE